MVGTTLTMLCPSKAAVHLAVGGFYQKSDYNADPILGADGDMGDNETASFDPIFFFHLCFINYTFWKWQEKHKLTAAGTLSVIKDPKEYDGTTTKEVLPDIEPKTPLDMKTPLYPFKEPDGSWYTSFDVTDIENQLPYTYGPGSLDPMIRDGPLLGTPDCAPIVKIKKTHNIHRAQYAGSFVIRTYAKGPGTTEEVAIGRDAILSRWNVRGCTNCQSSLEVQSLVPLDETLLSVLRGELSNDDIVHRADVQTHLVRTSDGRLMAPHAPLGPGEEAHCGWFVSGVLAAGLVCEK